MCVCNIITIWSCCISLHTVLCDGILYLLTIAVLWKTCKAVLPTFCLCNRLCLVSLTICKEICCDALRSLTILIICIIPGLYSIDIYRLRCMTIGNSETCLDISCNFSLISWHIACLFNSICYILTAGLKWNIVPCVCPVVIGIQCYF